MTRTSLFFGLGILILVSGILLIVGQAENHKTPDKVRAMESAYDCPEDLQQRHAAMNKYAGAIGPCLPLRLDAKEWANQELLGVATSLEKIEKACGPIATEFIEPTGEGECSDRTVLYYGTDHELRIEWSDLNGRQFPLSIEIVGSAFELDHGIKRGISLADLEKINQGPITFSGFSWDGSGQHRSFISGKLDYLDHDSLLSFRYAPDKNLYAANQDLSILGERTVGSNEEAVLKVRPYLDEITIRYGRKVRREALLDQLTDRIANLAGNDPEVPSTNLGTLKKCEDLEYDNNHQEGVKGTRRTCEYEKGLLSWEYTKKNQPHPVPYPYQYLVAFSTSHADLFPGLEAIFSAKRETLLSAFGIEKSTDNGELSIFPIEGAGPDVGISFDGDRFKALRYELETD